MKKTNLPIKHWQIFLLLSLFTVVIASIFVIPMINATWSHINNTKGPIQLSYDGSVVAFLSERSDAGTKVIIQANGGNRIWDFSRDKTLDKIALSSNGKYVAAVGNGVHLASITDKKLLWSWTQDGRDTIAISADGNWIVAGGYSAKIYLFKKESSQVIKQWNLGDKEDYPKDIAVSDDGKVVAAAGNLGVYLLDPATSSIKWKTKTDERVERIKLTSDGKYLLGIAAHSIYFWDKNKSIPLWKKQLGNSLIGANMSSNGDKIIASTGKGVSVMDNKGKELRHFEGDFGNSDVAMSQNGRYFYVNDGSRRLYAFDDSYSNSELRPFRIIRDINAGGHSRSIISSGSGNLTTYPKNDDIQFEQSNPAILALSPGIPILIKDGIFDMGMFMTNPTISSQRMSAEVRLSIPASSAFWTSITGQVTDRDPASVKSKLINYTMNNLPGSKVIHNENNLTIASGSSKRISFTSTIPDLTEGASFSNQLANGLSSLSPASLISNVLGKLKGPLSKLIGNDASNLAISVASRAITSSAGQMVYPMLGLGTVTLYDAQGKFYDQDTFYFIYLK